MALDSLTALHRATLPSPCILESEKFLQLAVLEALHPATLPAVAKILKIWAACSVELNHSTTNSYQHFISIHGNYGTGQFDCSPPSHPAITLLYYIWKSFTIGSLEALWWSKLVPQLQVANIFPHFRKLWQGGWVEGLQTANGQTFSDLRMQVDGRMAGWRAFKLSSAIIRLFSAVYNSSFPGGWTGGAAYYGYT